MTTAAQLAVPEGWERMIDALNETLRSGYLFGVYEEPVDAYGKRLIRVIIDAMERSMLAAAPVLPVKHIATDRCGFDRSASIDENRYVCTCGWRDGEAIHKYDLRRRRSTQQRLA